MSSKDPLSDYPAVTPYLIVNGAPKLIAFMMTAFNATERSREMRDNGSVMHAELKIENSLIMVADPIDGYPARPCMLYLFLDDCDSCYHRSLAAGATSIEEPADQPYGHRRAGVRDAFGNDWYISSLID